jgi:hypothetical protein
MKDYEGKYVIAFDTICEGVQCQMTTDDQGENGVPTLYDSEYDALVEVFDDNYSYLEMADKEDWAEFKEEFGWDKGSCMRRAETIVKKNYPISKLKAWIEEFNYYELYPMKAEDYVHGRRVFFGNGGITVTGTPINEM